MNQAPFSVPGLMPVRSPKEDEVSLALPDGSLVLPIYAQPEDEEIQTFSAIITSVNQRILLKDTNGTNVFNEVQDGIRKYVLVLDGSQDALPVGMVKVNVNGSNGYHRSWWVNNIDNPHNKGRGSRYKSDDPKPFVYALKGEFSLEPGFEGGFMPFPVVFPNPPANVMVSVTLGGVSQNIGASVTNIISEGFHVSLTEPIPEEGIYKLQWALWTQAIPSLLGTNLMHFYSLNLP
jgi:hypothetical protein